MVEVDLHEVFLALVELLVVLDDLVIIFLFFLSWLALMRVGLISLKLLIKETLTQDTISSSSCTCWLRRDLPLQSKIMPILTCRVVGLPADQFETLVQHLEQNLLT